MKTTPLAPRVLIIAVWFGPLPPWFPLWMSSCSYNPDVDWLVATDADWPTDGVPANVHFAKLTMPQLARRVTEFTGVEVDLREPYKACDLRPAFSCLLDLVPGTWDFWGHCDLDMLFGDVSGFLGPRLRETWDRIFGLGHFSVYRNTETANYFFQRPHPDLDYREILGDVRHRAFDEHQGVNKIWHLHGGRFYEDESVVADIDPHVARIRRAQSRHARNTRLQAFAFDRGRVVRYFADRGLLRQEEFMYIHFQKRRFTEPILEPESQAAWLTPSGLLRKTEGPPELKDLKRFNDAPQVSSIDEALYLARGSFRLARRRLGRGHPK